MIIKKNIKKIPSLKNILTDSYQKENLPPQQKPNK